MQLYFIVTTTTLNAEISGLRISALSNSVKNIFYIAAVYGLLLFGRTNCTLRMAIILTSIGMKVVTLPPLTNTLFSIHPPLLYLSFIMSIFSAMWKKRILAYTASSLSLLAMFLGGLWSTQELSWGGWWNWDVLECGVGYIWIIYVSGIHTQKRRLVTPRQVQALALSTVWLVYTCMNKYGLATSIHSFVASKSARTHYPSVILLYAIISLLYVSKVLKPGIALAAFLCASYSLLQWCIFFKKPIIAIALMAIIYRKVKMPLIKSYHSAISCAALFVVFFNLQNTPFFNTNECSVKTCSTFCCGPLWCFMTSVYSPSNLIWSNMLLSKPRYTSGIFFSADSVRSILGRHATLCFLK